VIPHLSEAAALGAALSWSFCSIFFASASKCLGAGTVNRMRLALAVVLLAAAHFGLYGTLYPQLTLERLAWLALSGLCAHVLGDGILYQAYVLVGPRTALLFGTLTPVFATTMAWIMLGETLSWDQLFAMGLVLAGVTWVIAQRPSGREVTTANRSAMKWGIVLSVGNALFQAIALVSAKQGMEGGFSPLSAVTVRMSCAMIAAWGWAALCGDVGSTLSSLRTSRLANAALVAGTLTGPFLGASLSLIALAAAPVGVTSILLNLSPVILLPLSHFLLGERVNPQVIGGTLVAMIGVALVILR
jgi:drug/metabolite transporter (DMT)-like permease